MGAAALADDLGAFIRGHGAAGHLARQLADDLAVDQLKQVEIGKAAHVAVLQVGRDVEDLRGLRRQRLERLAVAAAVLPALEEDERIGLQARRLPNAHRVTGLEQGDGEITDAARG